MNRLASLGLLPILLAGCTRAPPTAAPSGSTPVAQTAETSLTDWVRNPPLAESEQDAACPRLLSAAPNVTEICCALGLRDCLVGRTRYCKYPPSVEAVPSIGALNDLNTEVLLEIRPDLVLVSGSSRAIRQRLAGLGVRLESLPDTSLADLFLAIEQTGALVGRVQTARRLVELIRADLDAVAARFAGTPRVRVLLLTGPLSDPPRQADAAGPGSFYDDLLRRAGHVNVVPAGGRAFAPVSLEFVLDSDPDVIIELSADGASRPNGDADARRVWSKVGPLRAVAAGRVHVLVGPQHFLLGPRIAQTFEALCRTISPDQDG